jgi:hypothetical protein
VSNYRNAELDRQVRDLDERIAKLRTYVDNLTPVLAREQQKLSDLEQRYATTEMADADYGWQRQLLLDNLACIERTQTTVVGTQEICDLMRGKPGLRDAERTLTRLLAKRNALDQKANIDPDAKVRARLVQGNFYTDGRRILPGEIVELNNRQFENWRDLFEPVTS